MDQALGLFPEVANGLGCRLLLLSTLPSDWVMRKIKNLDVLTSVKLTHDIDYPFVSNLVPLKVQLLKLLILPDRIRNIHRTLIPDIVRGQIQNQ